MDFSSIQLCICCLCASSLTTYSFRVLGLYFSTHKSFICVILQKFLSLVYIIVPRPCFYLWPPLVCRSFLRNSVPSHSPLCLVTSPSVLVVSVSYNLSPVDLLYRASRCVFDHPVPRLRDVHPLNM